MFGAGPDRIEGLAGNFDQLDIPVFVENKVIIVNFLVQCINGCHGGNVLQDELYAVSALTLYNFIIRCCQCLAEFFIRIRIFPQDLLNGIQPALCHGECSVHLQKVPGFLRTGYLVSIGKIFHIGLYFRSGTRGEQQGNDLPATGMQIVKGRGFDSVLQPEASIFFYPDGINLADLSDSQFIKIEHASITVFNKNGDLYLFSPGTGQYY